MRLLFPLLVSLWLLALCYEDLRYRRLPNALTLGGAAVALVWRLGAGSWPAFLSGLSGGLLASLLLILPFLLHSAGGGDVKMLFAAGAVVGRGGVMGLLLYVSLAGLALAFVFLVLGRVDRGRLVHYVRCVFDWRYDRAAGRASLPPKTSEKARVPFGLAIAAGTWLQLFMPLGVAG